MKGIRLSGGYTERFDTKVPVSLHHFPVHFQTPGVLREQAIRLATPLPGF
jgi:hypothetical protein